MPVTMICPNLACRRTVTAPETARGRVVRCGHCKQPFLVPNRETPGEQPADSTDKSKKAKAKAKAR